jgi:hypothetical protein
MSKRNERTTITDPELIALFADDPEGLAIVDAIAATQTGGQRRAIRRVAVLAAVVMAGVVVAAVRLGDSRAGVIEKALRAVSMSDVVHLRFVDQRVAAQVVDLRTGAVRPVRHTIDQWYSPARGTRRTRDKLLGYVVSDSTTRLSDQRDTLDLGSFTSSYRAALRNHSAVEIDGPRVDGRSAYWLSFRDSRGVRVRVAVDRRTFVPTFVDYPLDKRSFAVTEVSAAQPRTLTAQPGQVRRSLSGIVVSAKAIAPIANQLRALELPLAVMGLTAARVRTLRIASVGGDDAVTEVVYSNAKTGSQLPSKYVRVFVSERPFGALEWAPWYIRPAGQVLVIAGPHARAFLQREGSYISIESSLGRLAAVRAARTIAAGARKP